MNAWILAAEAFAVYGLVLWSHSLRHRFGLAFFYALLGSLTAVMSWVTDAGVAVRLGEVTFLVGSTVFYTSLLLGVFVVYVFDGPRATRVAILTVVGVSGLVPVISVVLHLQTHISSTTPLAYVPIPSLRVNSASVLTTLADLLFLAVCWEYLHGRLGRIPLAAKAFLTLLGVMWLDVLLFNTLAFIGSEDYLPIMKGTFFSRLIITAFAAPILWGYLSWQNSIAGVTMPRRAIFAILQELTELQVELQTAREEIARRKAAEASLARSERRYRQLLLGASEPIAVIQNGLYLLHNTRLAQLTGISEQDIQRATFTEFVHPRDIARVEEAFDEAIRRKGQTTSLDFQGVNAAGDELSLQANIVGVEWEGAGAVLAFLHDVTRQRRDQKRLMDEALADQLTGALNRRGFSDKYELAAGRLLRGNRIFSVLYLDVDQFKSINDTYGHGAGDDVLRMVAEAVRSHVREDDLIGRMGGDEFAVMLSGADSGEALTIASRILESVSRGRTGNGPEGVTVSIGCASAGNGVQETPAQLLDRADKALLAAKRDGRNQVRGS